LMGIKDVNRLNNYIKGRDGTVRDGALALKLISDTWKHYRAEQAKRPKLDPLRVAAPPLTSRGPVLQADVSLESQAIARDFASPRKPGSKPGALSFTLPGTHYVGPGNDLESGPPTSALDAEARIHDIRYAQLQDLGIDPYTHYTAADQELLSAAAREHGFQAAAVEATFMLKKHLLPHLEFKGTLPAISSYQAQEGMEDGEGSGQTLGGGGGGGPTAALWSNETAFEGNKVVSTLSRQVLVPFDPQQRYKPISLPASGQGDHGYA
ncbi:hypothetical protein J9B33_26940, partial [Klebsiella pneumoniae]